MTIDAMAGGLCALLATGLISWWPPRRETPPPTAATAGNCPCGGDIESCTCGKGPALPPRAVPSWARDGAR